MRSPFLTDKSSVYREFQKDLEVNVHLMNGQSASVIEFFAERGFLEYTIVKGLYEKDE